MTIIDKFRYKVSFDRLYAAAVFGKSSGLPRPSASRDVGLANYSKSAFRVLECVCITEEARSLQRIREKYRDVYGER